jgi:uncharacterized protein with HEPN domain
VWLDMRHAVDRAVLVKETAGSWQAFRDNDLIKGALESVFVRLDEVYNRLGGPDGDAPHVLPVFPWRQMHDMRRRIVHDYPTIDYRLVWDALVQFESLSQLLETRVGLARGIIENPRQWTPPRRPPPARGAEPPAR